MNTNTESKPEYRLRNTVLGIGLIIVLGIVLGPHDDRQATLPGNTDVTSAENPRTDTERWANRAWSVLYPLMRDPGSFDVETVSAPGWAHTRLGDQQFAMVRYHARNGLGGMNRETRVIAGNDSGGYRSYTLEEWGTLRTDAATDNPSAAKDHSKAHHASP